MVILFKCMLNTIKYKYKIKPSEASSALAFFVEALLLSSGDFLFFPFFSLVLLSSSSEDSSESLSSSESSSSSSELSFFALVDNASALEALIGALVSSSSDSELSSLEDSSFAFSKKIVFCSSA